MDKDTITKVARLARIAVTEDDKEHYAKELTGILKWIEELNKVNTDGVPMLSSVVETPLPWREDKVTDGNQQEAVVKNAPASDYGCFVVPKVIE